MKSSFCPVRTVVQKQNKTTVVFYTTQAVHALEDAGVPFSAFESLFNEEVAERYQRMFRCTCAEHEMCECDAATAAAEILGSETFLSGFDSRTPMQRHRMIREIDSKLRGKDAECKLPIVKSAYCAIVSDDLG